MARRVWLLGSGFSKPLGGPLLRDLFRQERFEDCLSFFPRGEYPQLGDSLPWVQLIFGIGVNEGIWENAEQFLVYVDDAFSGHVVQKRKRLLKLIQRMTMPAELLRGAPPATSYPEVGIPDSLNRVVRRALAAECSRFLLGADPKQDELWLPYREWVGSLDPDSDVILTFNYDRVVELVAGATEAPIFLPTPTVKKRKGTIPLLKLHGSVDWRLREDPSDNSQLVLDAHRIPENEILKSPDDVPAIAPPGGSKARFVARHLQFLWDAAEAALRDADQLIVVGYSFPDTDPGVAHRFLSVLAEGSTRHRQAHIVLGPDIMSATTRRVVALFKSTSIKNVVQEVEFFTPSAVGLQLIPHRLWTQDFIGRHRSFTG